MLSSPTKIKLICSYLLELCSVTHSLQPEILNRMHDRIVQNFLDLAILLELRKRPLSDHDIVDFAQRKFSITLPSATVSSHLITLGNDGLIRAENSQGKTVYALTERGEETTKELSNIKDKILGLFLNLFVGE